MLVIMPRVPGPAFLVLNRLLARSEICFLDQVIVIVITAPVLGVAPLHQKRFALRVKETLVNDIPVSVVFPSYASVAFYRVSGPAVFVKIIFFLDIITFVIALPE